jgi:hypothetical protein
MREQSVFVFWSIIYELTKWEQNQPVRASNYKRSNLKKFQTSLISGIHFLGQKLFNYIRHYK